MSKNRRDQKHIEIYKANYGEITFGFHVHHIDGNHLNNDPENLIAIPERLHVLIHRISKIHQNRTGQNILPNKNQIEFLYRDLAKTGWNLKKNIDPHTWNYKRRLPQEETPVIVGSRPVTEDDFKLIKSARQRMVDLKRWNQANFVTALEVTIKKYKRVTVKQEKVLRDFTQETGTWRY